MKAAQTEAMRNDFQGQAVTQDGCAFYNDPGLAGREESYEKEILHNYPHIGTSN